MNLKPKVRWKVKRGEKFFGVWQQEEKRDWFLLRLHRPIHANCVTVLWFIVHCSKPLGFGLQIAPFQRLISNFSSLWLISVLLWFDDERRIMETNCGLWKRGLGWLIWWLIKGFGPPPPPEVISGATEFLTLVSHSDNVFSNKKHDWDIQTSPHSIGLLNIGLGPLGPLKFLHKPTISCIHPLMDWHCLVLGFALSSPIQMIHTPY